MGNSIMVKWPSSNFKVLKLWVTSNKPARLRLIMTRPTPSYIPPSISNTVKHGTCVIIGYVKVLLMLYLMSFGIVAKTILQTISLSIIHQLNTIYNNTNTSSRALPFTVNIMGEGVFIHYDETTY